MDISIIIPVYNAELFIEKCLDSIFSQQFKGTYEVIAVDDGSSDNSWHLLYKYQKSEERLIIIKNALNQKQSITRATGMNASTGDYIMHVDADDWLLPNALENLYCKLIKTEADIIVFNYSRMNSKGKQTSVQRISEELITNDKSKVQQHFLGASVNKIVKRKLTSNMISSKVKTNTTEDLLYATEILLRADKIYLIPDVYYVYYINNKSITWTVNLIHLLQNQIIILNELYKIVKHYHADFKIISNILNYLEKSIFFVIFQVAFLDNEKITFKDDLIKAFSLFPQMNDYRLNAISLALDHKSYSILQVYKHFGIKKILSTLIRSCKIYVFKLFSK